jgi:ferredoxin
MAELLHIDWTACEGRGLCAELLPEILAVDEWGYPVARDGSREPAVPDALVPHARRAVDQCPRMALRLRAATGSAAARSAVAVSPGPGGAGTGPAPAGHRPWRGTCRCPRCAVPR